jgi:hypothetical protein
MTQQGINKLSEAIERMSIKASLLIKARNLKLSNPQMIVYRKVLNNELIIILDYRSIDVLIRKGLIQTKAPVDKSGLTSAEALKLYQQNQRCGYEAI